MKSNIYVGLLVILVVLLSCEDKLTNNISILSANHQEFSVIELPYDQRPNTRVNINSANLYKEPFDADSIEMFHYRNKVTYHPVYLAQRCRVFINAFTSTQDTTYLIRAEKYANKLIEIYHYFNETYYAPYSFPYAVHGDSLNNFTVPWYSGMAQGEMLSVFTRLYNVTEKSIYLEYAKSFINSFYALKSENDIWVSRVDDNKYYWIEEYPHDVRPGRTLNGFNYAIFGLYEYLLSHNDPKAKLIYDLSLTTVKHYLPQYLRPDSGSFYCLGHKINATPGYHHLHITQLKQLYSITGDKFFLDTANDFEAAVNGQK